MKIYLASGYSVMNVTGRERELRDMCHSYRRLYSYFFATQPKIYENLCDLMEPREI